MMRLPEFNYLAARSLTDAVAALADDPEHTRLVAGGTDLWPNMKRRHQTARTVVGLGRIAELRGIRADGATGGTAEIRLGATTTLAAITGSQLLRSAYPGVVRAAASIATPLLRNMGTIGGNLALDTRCFYYNQNEEWRRSIDYCMKEAGEICWVRPTGNRCLAVSSTDGAPVLSAIGARVKLASKAGERVVSLRDLYQDDGIDYLAKGRDEIITEILLPPAQGWQTTYWKLRRRGSVDFPVLGVGVALRQGAGGVVEELEIWLGGLGSRPIRASAASDSLLGQPLSEEGVPRAAELARKEAAVSDNTDLEPGWRRYMVEVYVEGALRELAGLPQTTRAPRHGAFALEV
jgi:4-hydroxybenzoyl-CoA reductase subunit beta